MSTVRVPSTPRAAVATVVALLVLAVIASASVVVPARASSLPPYRSTMRTATKADVALSWHPGCPVGPGSLRVLRLTYLGFDGRAHTGTLVVSAKVASDVRYAFRRLYEKRFPIRGMKRVDLYGGSDNRSMAADNTSAFNCRKAVQAGPATWSNHAYGVAVDINPRENPYVLGGKVLPPAGSAYLNRSSKAKGVIHARGPVVGVFSSLGFRWGGVWSNPDYQHFDRK